MSGACDLNNCHSLDVNSILKKYDRKGHRCMYMFIGCN